MTDLVPREEDRTFVARYLPACVRAPAAARAWSADVLRRWGIPQVTDDLEVVITELTTNSVQAGAVSMAVRIEWLRGPGVVEVAVWDDAPGEPRSREPDFVAESGRGLFLVGELSTAWGHEPGDGGKTIWARLALAGPPSGPPSSKCGTSIRETDCPN